MRFIRTSNGFLKAAKWKTFADSKVLLYSNIFSTLIIGLPIARHSFMIVQSHFRALLWLLLSFRYIKNDFWLYRITSQLSYNCSELLWSCIYLQDTSKNDSNRKELLCSGLTTSQNHFAAVFQSVLAQGGDFDCMRPSSDSFEVVRATGVQAAWAQGWAEVNRWYKSWL